MRTLFRGPFLFKMTNDFAMNLDKLFILKSNKENNDSYEDNCWTTELFEILLSKFPDLNQKINVERVFQDSAESVVELVGKSNQSFPILILAYSAPKGMETHEYRGTRFVKGKDNIFNVLRERHKVPVFNSLAL